MDFPKRAGSPTRGVLDYAGSDLSPRRRLKHVAAILFAVLAIGLGGLFAANSLHLYSRSLSEPTTRDRRLFRQDAIRFLACSVVMLIPGVWYARIGIRGELIAGVRPTGPTTG